MWDFEERLNIADDVNLTVFSTLIAISRGKNPMVSTDYHNLYLLLQLISGMRRKEKHWTSNFFHLPRTTFILKNILIEVNSQIGAGVGQIMKLIAITNSVLCAVHWQNSKKHTAEYKFMGRQDMSHIIISPSFLSTLQFDPAKSLKENPISWKPAIWKGWQKNIPGPST